MDTNSQWPQNPGMKPPAEETLITNYSSSKSSNMDRKTRPQKEQPRNCPRCNSINTKFCYYNNYSLSQPRFFCKTCRRYWTEGGSLRNIPVGGGSRKNKRSSTKKPPHENLLPPQIFQNPNNKIQESQDLNLGFSTSAPHDFKAINELIQVPNFEINANHNKELQNNPSSSSSNSSHHYSALELLTGRGNSFMPMPVADPSSVYSSGFSMPEFKSSLNFSLDVLGSNYGGFQGANGKLLFPYEDLNKQVSTNVTTNVEEQSRSDQIGDPTTGYWNGMISGGSW